MIVLTTMLIDMVFPLNLADRMCHSESDVITINDKCVMNASHMTIGVIMQQGYIAFRLYIMNQTTGHPSYTCGWENH